MPNCFSLTAKADLKAGPVALQKVDDEMRKHFHVEPSDSEWYKNWYNTIGFSLALGADWTKLRERWGDMKGDVIDYLEANYTIDAWVEIGKR